MAEGDANTALFHLYARHRKQKNYIGHLTSDDGQLLSSHEDKEKNIFNFYNSLLGDAPERDVIVNLEALGILQHDLSEMETPISKEEVWKTNGLSLQTKLQGRMASLETFIRPVGL
jgi:hypothetical protein